MLLNYYQHCKQENSICVTIFNCQFIQKYRFFIFDGWKAQFLLYSNQKHTFEHIQQVKVISAQMLVSKTRIFPSFS